MTTHDTGWENKWVSVLIADYVGSGDTQPCQHALRCLAGMVETTEVTIADISDVAGNSIAAAVRQILAEGER